MAVMPPAALNVGQNDLHPLVEGEPRFGEVLSPRGAIDQANAQMLQCLHVLADEVVHILAFLAGGREGPPDSTALAKTLMLRTDPFQTFCFKS